MGFRLIWFGFGLVHFGFTLQNIQPLIGTPEPLTETGVLANHSSHFSLVKRMASQPAGHTDRPVYGGRTTI